MFPKRRKGALVLEDGTRYAGELFGAEKSVSGEVAFSTNMAGYTESLSDPSYAGQILVSTYPIAGNYGLPSDQKDPETGLMKYWESSKLHPMAYVVHDYTEKYSHWNAAESLGEGLRRYGVTGLTGVDTRALTRHLRDHGPLLGKIVVEGEPEAEFRNYDELNLVDLVSTKEVITFPAKKGKRIVLVDCGTKENIIREFLSRDINVTLVPWDYDFNQIDCDGVFISNGPGNPNMCTVLIERVRAFIDKGEKPLAGICMGNQILALAIGARVQKMTFGHRAVNQPVRKVGTDSCYITSQNHGFAVDNATIPDHWRVYFENLNDGSNEGLIHDSGRYFSVQFHPENHAGPLDTEFIFDDFINLL